MSTKISFFLNIIIVFLLSCTFSQASELKIIPLKKPILSDEIINIAHHATIRLLENTDSFSQKEWNQLYKLSEETFVEESDSLKETAAGAGLIDND